MLGALLLASLVAILTTFGILVTLVYETILFFGKVSPIDFLFGLQWNPDPMSTGAVDGDRYGAIPLFWGTLFIGAIIAMIVAIPLGMMSAIYLTQYAHPKLRAWVKPALEGSRRRPNGCLRILRRAHHCSVHPRSRGFGGSEQRLERERAGSWSG